PPASHPLSLHDALPILGAGLGVIGPPAAPPPARRYRRARWRPRISGIALLSGIVGAVSVLTLLQQYGKLFPTYAMGIRALVAGRSEEHTSELQSLTNLV